MHPRVRRKLNKKKTLDRFERRMRNILTKVDYRSMEDAYFSTFEIFNTISTDRSNDNKLCNNAFVVMRLAREQGIRVKGITSERKKNGIYCAQLLNDDIREIVKVIYCGRYNFFTKHKNSKYRLIKEDKVYD